MQAEEDLANRVTEEEKLDRSKGKKIDQYIFEMNGMTKAAQYNKLNRLKDIGAISEANFEYAADVLNIKY
jgi:hypothetical protein